MPFDYANEFALSEDVIYLNHAAVSPWPVRTADAVKRFADENASVGSRNYMEWLGVEQDLREKLRALVNAESTDDISLLKNTSEALSVVAYGLDWQAGDNVVISNEEFPSNRVVWQSLARFGVEVREADLRSGASPEDALITLTDERTRVLSISSVQYASGLRMDLETLGTFCRAEGILFCVDAIQSLGALQFDVQANLADFVMADGHKWMLGPEGLAVFYCRPQLRERLRLNQYGWHMVEDHLAFDRRDWQPASSARRFECGSPNMLGIFALHASLSLLEEIGMVDVERQVCENAAFIMDFVARHDGLDLITLDEPGRYGGIVTFRPQFVSAEQLYGELTRAGVVCALRGGGVRFSPHFYTPQTVMEKALLYAVQTR